MSDFLNIYIFHWTPAKAIWIGGHTLSWDARCAGIWIGFGITILFHLLAGRKAKYLPARPVLILCSLLFLPLFIDVFTLHYGYRMPVNDIRLLTGLSFGTAFGVFLYPTFIKLAYSKALARPTLNSLSKLILLFTLVLGAFFLKSIDHVVIFFILESFAVWGFLSLFVMISAGVFIVLKNCFISCIGKTSHVNLKNNKAI